MKHTKNFQAGASKVLPRDYSPCFSGFSKMGIDCHVTAPIVNTLNSQCLSTLQSPIAGVTVLSNIHAYLDAHHVKLTVNPGRNFFQKYCLYIKSEQWDLKKRKIVRY